MNLVSGSLTRCPTFGKDQAERQHRAEIIDEAGGKNDLADLSLVEAGLDHDRVDNGDRGGRQRDPGDLRLRPGPIDDEPGEQQDPEIRGEEAHHADGHARPEVLADDLGVDLSAGKEGQQDGTEAGQIVDPRRQCQADGVARDGTHHDLDQGDRNSHPDRDDRRRERQPDPQSRNKPDVVHDALLSLSPRGGGMKKATSRWPGTYIESHR